MGAQRAALVAVLALLLAQHQSAAVSQAEEADRGALSAGASWRRGSLQPAQQQVRRRVPKMTVLHEEARIFHFSSFLSDEECDHLIRLAQAGLQRSSVIVPEGSKISEHRTSSGTFLPRGGDAVVADIEARIARWTLMPVGNGEPLQVLRYEQEQEYKPHMDYLGRRKDLNGGQRVATVLMFLNTVEEGGETTFPRLPAPNGDNGPGFSECARRVLAVKPERGSALLFHSLTLSGQREDRSLHSACPVLRGVKWSAPKWIRVGHFAVKGELQAPMGQRPLSGGRLGGCTDSNQYCGAWAAQGECSSNPQYMRMQCRRSCGLC